MLKKIFSSFNPEALRKYALNASWLMGEKLVRLVAGTAVGFSVNRYLGPGKLGQLNFATSFIFLFMALAALGLTDLVTRELVKRPNLRNRLLGTAFTLRLAASTVVCLLVNLSAWLFSSFTETLQAWSLPVVSLTPDDRLFIFIISLGLFFNPLDILVYFFHATVQSKRFAQVQMVVITIVSLVRLLLIWNGQPVVYFAIVLLAETMMTGIGLLIAYRVQGFHIREWRFNKIIAKRLLRDSAPLMVGALMVSLYLRIDMVLIKPLLGNVANGQYAAAARLSEIWYLIPTTLCTSLYPAILHAKKSSETLYYKRLQQLFDLMVIIGAVVAIPVTVFAEEVLWLTSGKDYMGGANVLRIHIWTGMLVGLGMASGQWLISENMGIIAMRRTMVTAIASIGMNVIFIRHLGIEGVALASLCSQLIATYFFDLSDRRTHLMFRMKSRALLGISTFQQGVKLLKKE